MQPVLAKDALLAIVGPLTGLSQDAIVWGLDGQPAVNEVDNAIVRFVVRGFAGVGVDQTVRVYDSTTGANQSQQVGQRVLRIQVLCEAYDAGVEASEILDQLRTGLFTDDTTNATTAANLAFQRATGTVNVPTEYEERVVNAATFDLFLGGAAVTDLLPPRDGTPGWIATVNGNNKVPLTTS